MMIFGLIAAVLLGVLFAPELYALREALAIR
jgi:hypothetical protein